MAVTAKAGVFQITAGSTSDIVVTGVGGTPKFIVFHWNGYNALDEALAETSIQRGYGFAVSPTQRVCVTSQSEHAQASSDTDSGHRTDSCIASLDIGGVWDGQATLKSLDSDGFTLQIDQAFGRAMRVGYLAVWGDSIERVSNIGTITEPDSTGSQSYTAVDGTGWFQGNIVFFLSAELEASPPAIDTDSWVMFGAADSSGNQFSLGTGSDHSRATTRTQHYFSFTESIGLPNTGIGSINGRADFTGFTTTGFTMNWIERNESRLIFYVVIKGGDWRVGQFDTRTDTNNLAITGLASQPAGALIFSPASSSGFSAVDTLTAHDRSSVGAWSSLTDRWVFFTRDADNVADSDCAHGASDEAVYLNGQNGSTTVDGRGDIQSVDSTGFTLVMDDPDPFARQCVFIAVGPASTGTGHDKSLSDSLSLADQHYKTPGLRRVEAISLSDQLTKAVGKVLASTLNLADALTFTLAFGRRVGDTWAGADALNFILLFGRSVSDTWTAADAAVKNLNLLRSESLTATDAVARLVNWARAFSESLLLLEAQTKTLGLVRGETLSHTDAVYKTLGKILADSFGLSDAALLQLARAVAVGDEWTGTDQHYKLVGKFLVEILTETDALRKTEGHRVGSALSLADALARQVSWFRALLETVSQFDQVTRTVGKALADTLGLTEASALLQLARSLVVGDALQLLDEVFKAAGKHAIETLALVDQVTKNPGHAAGETVDLDDAPQFAVGWARLVGDSTVLADQIYKTVGKFLTDSLGLTEAGALTQLARALVLGDEFSLSEAQRKELGLVKAEAFTVAEQLAKTLELRRGETVVNLDALQLGIHKVLADLLVLDEALSKAINKFVADALSLGEDVFGEAAVGKTFNQVLGELLGMQESLLWGYALLVAVGDSLRLVDRVRKLRQLPEDEFIGGVALPIYSPVFLTPSLREARSPRFPSSEVRLKTLREIENPNLYDVVVLQHLVRLLGNRFVTPRELLRHEFVFRSLGINMHLNRYFTKKDGPYAG